MRWFGWFREREYFNEDPDTVDRTKAPPWMDLDARKHLYQQQQQEQQRPFVREKPRTLDVVANELQAAIERKKKLEQTLADQNLLISKLAEETQQLAEGKTINLKEQMEHTEAILTAVKNVKEAGYEIANRAGHRGVASALGVSVERTVSDTEASSEDGEGEQPFSEGRTLQVPKDRRLEELKVLEGHISRHEKGPSYHENEPANEPSRDDSRPQRHRLIKAPTPKEVQGN